MVNSKDYRNITYKQISDMKHAIGFENRRVTGIKRRKYEPYRNYFCAGECDIPDWDNLVSIGLADKCKDERYYYVNDDGRIFLEFVTGVKILNESR